MAEILLDTHVLLRLVEVSSSGHVAVSTAVTKLERSAHNTFFTPQCMVELWAVDSRPLISNGLNWSTEECKRQIELIRERFPMLPDCDEILSFWPFLVSSQQIRGKRTHDARLAAVMRAYGIRYLLTFNGSHFAAFPGVIVLDPEKVASGEVIISG